MLKTMLHGMSMALADSVPGVSGGTIAFILGFYERFLSALHDFFGRDNVRRKDAALYLVKFGLGWILGMGGSVLILSKVFEQNIYLLSSLFLGLTAGAIPFIAWEERESLRLSLKTILFSLLGVGLVAAMTFLRGSDGSFGSLNFRSLTLFQLAYLVVCGMLAISAMLLPGISGSTLLLIFGVYVPAVNAAKELLHLHFAYLPGVLALAIGIGLGMILTADCIRKALQNHRSATVHLILGLMVGSLYAIAMGPTTLDVPQAPLTLGNFSVIGFLAGILLLVFLEYSKHRPQAAAAPRAQS